MEAPPSSLSSRASPDFLLAALGKAACGVFVKENRIWSCYIFKGEVDDISTRAALLDAAFGFVVSGHEFSRAVNSWASQKELLKTAQKRPKSCLFS